MWIYVLFEKFSFPVMWKIWLEDLKGAQSKGAHKKNFPFVTVQELSEQI